jgi:FKBP-type peptidyl-prolyl cis-trans isomerase
LSYKYSSNTLSRGGTKTQLNGTEVKINDEGSGAYIPDCYQVKVEWNGKVEEFEMTRM